MNTGYTLENFKTNFEATVALQEYYEYEIEVIMNYSEIDLMQLEELRKACTSNKKLPKIDLEVLLCNFDGQSFFSICFD